MRRIDYSSVFNNTRKNGDSCVEVNLSAYDRTPQCRPVVHIISGFGGDLKPRWKITVERVDAEAAEQLSKGPNQ
ncbi:MAG: hypothetical protein INH13_25840 [Cupriavidus sp.]|nr:hypothetical protein [Cupriavidus sp.]